MGLVSVRNGQRQRAGPARTAISEEGSAEYLITPSHHDAKLAASHGITFMRRSRTGRGHLA